jgi:gluconokinase
MNGFVIGLDIGTTTVKAIAITVGGPTDGRVAGAADEAVPMNTAADGAATQSAEHVADAVVRVVRRAVDALGGGAVIHAVGVSAAMHTMLPVDRAGRPLCEATTWGDTRARSAEQAVRESVDPRALYEETGCPVRWLYWPARLRWWAEHRPGFYADAARWVSIKEFAVHRLTGRWAVDVGVASATGLLDVRRGEWSASALAAARMGDAEKLSALVEGDEVIGGVGTGAASATGLREGTPIVAGSSDGALANIGAVGIGVGETVITIGTSGAVRVMSAEPAFDGAARTWCYLVRGGRAKPQALSGSGARSEMNTMRPWLVGGAVNNGGVATAWVFERFYAGEGSGAWALMLDEASRVPIGAEGVTCRPHFTGERSPWWNPAMTGAFRGLTLRHGRAHMARAVLEGVAMSIAEVWDCMGGAARLGQHARLTGGVTRSPLWCGIVADVLGVTLEASDSGDASARGAAMLAAVGVGCASVDAVNAWVKGDALERARYQADARRCEQYRAVRERWRAADAVVKG